MNNIGLRIRELRRKNDLTQEKLADFLGVTYQSVSKWECGTTLPDLAMIVPLARILQVSADELLGMKPPEKDERKAYFDAEYFQFWKKEHEEDLDIARQAAAEYPGECRYLYWLASNEWYVGYDSKYMGTETEKELLSNAVRHYEMVLENCEDEELRNHAIFGLVQAYRSLHRYDDAKKTALLYPEEPESCRDDVLMLCLQGEELNLLYKKQIKKYLLKLCGALSQLWYYEDPPCEHALDAEETIIRSVITDGNYQHFHITLSMIQMERAEIAIRTGNADLAVRALSEARKHAEAFDTMQESGLEQYTAPILSGYTEDHRNNRKEDWCMTDEVRQHAEKSIFDPIRNRADFQAVLD